MGQSLESSDNVNTDEIIPGRYNVTTDRSQLARYCLCEVRPDFPEGVKPGDVIVAGRNFGCGSPERTCAGGSAGLRSRGGDRGLLCPDLLPKRHQCRPASS